MVARSAQAIYYALTLALPRGHPIHKLASVPKEPVIHSHKAMAKDLPHIMPGAQCTLEKIALTHQAEPGAVRPRTAPARTALGAALKSQSELWSLS